MIYSPPRTRVLKHYLYSITVLSSAPQTTLGRGPRAGIRTQDERSRGRDSDHYNTTPPLEVLELVKDIANKGGLHCTHCNLRLASSSSPTQTQFSSLYLLSYKCRKPNKKIFKKKKPRILNLDHQFHFLPI